MNFDDDDLRKAPREFIAKFVSAMEKEFDLSDVHRQQKAMFSRMQELNEGGRCFICKTSEMGHFYEECVARRFGRIDHLYRPRSHESKQP